MTPRSEAFLYFAGQLYRQRLLIQPFRWKNMPPSERRPFNDGYKRALSDMETELRRLVEAAEAAEA